MDGFCRACLSNFDDPVDLLQYTEERRRLFVYSTGLQVKRNDVFTFQICKECYYSMRTACKFKKMCRTSDKKIKKYLTVKDEDDGMEFTTFLKKNESLTFRLPILSGSSTPAYQKAKDDDNESTCTSIQNFMTDILRADEIPDSEARIIREVIEEEADVLEDSLDSHWLDDDVAVDEFRLDLSLSRFSTPRSTNHERMTSPDHREVTSDITSGEDFDSIPIDISLKKFTDPVENSYVLHNIHETDVLNETKKSRCVIDKNLEKALRDENNQEFSLQEILASPVFPSKSGASTPTIKHIIFGDKVKNTKKSKSPKFESDLDFLMGKLDKSMKSQQEFQKKKLDLVIEPDKIMEGKHELSIKKAMKLEKENIDVEKIVGGRKIDIGKFSAGKILQEKLDICKGKLYQEKQLFKEKLGIFFEDNFNFDKFDEAKIEVVQPDVDNLNVGKPNEDPIDVNIDALLEVDNDMNVGHDNDNNVDDIRMELFREPVGEPLEEDSDDDILEEFLNAEKEKLANVEMKKKAVTNLINAAQIDDAELTQLLEEAYDHNIGIIKGKKFINTQSSQKGVKHPKKMMSPVENKYCITNFYCKMCDVKFKSLKALKIHFTRGHRYKIDTPKKPWQVKVKMCDLCGKTFTNTSSLVNHLKNHDKPKQYTCEKCTLTFKSEHSLKNHQRTHMKTSQPVKKLNGLDPKYVCKICGAISTSSSNHITHERRHSKSYTLHCEDCGKGFYRTTELITHRRLHTGEKPYSCVYCDQSFSRRDTLNRHLKCHTDERKYSCQYCNRRFTKSYDVKIHQANNKSCLQLQERVHEGHIPV